MLQALAVFSELVDSECSTLGSPELVNTFGDCNVGDFGDVDDLTHGAFEVVHASGEDDACATESGRVATGCDPVTLHSANDFDGIFCDLIGGVAKFEPSAVFEDQVFNVHHVLEVQVASANVELLAHGLVDFTQSEDIDLDDLGDIDQQHFVVWTSATRSVETGADNLRQCSSSGEVVACSHTPDRHGLRDDLSIGDGNPGVYALKLLLAPAADLFDIVAFATAHAAEGIGIDRVGMAGVLADEATLHCGRAAG